ncbi:MAG: sirohydrochlorin chelatase [Nannocystaceae bacterium]|nr:CbiX/SirB N-terminal domain-containing protein [bacterium]
MTPPIVLIAHGSPDPDWRAPLERVAEVANARAGSDGPQVVLAYMDFIEPSLSEVVAELAARGATEVRVVAAFLSAGGRHLKRDVPRLVAEVDAATAGVRVHLVPGALGDDAGVIEALAAAALDRGQSSRSNSASTSARNSG